MHKQRLPRNIADARVCPSHHGQLSAVASNHDRLATPLYLRPIAEPPRLRIRHSSRAKRSRHGMNLVTSSSFQI